MKGNRITRNTIPKETHFESCVCSFGLRKNNHKELTAGFFVEYDFDNKSFYDGKKW